MYLSKDEILGAADQSFTELEISEWRGTIRIGNISAAEKGKYESGLFKFNADGTRTINEKNLATLRTRLIVACVVDDEGKRVFTEKDIEALGEKSAAVIQDVFEACQEHNGMEPPAVDEIEGN